MNLMLLYLIWSICSLVGFHSLLVLAAKLLLSPKHRKKLQFPVFGWNQEFLEKDLKTSDRVGLKALCLLGKIERLENKSKYPVTRQYQYKLF